MSFGIPVRNGLGVGLLASTSLATRRGASTAFSPASLFTTGEPGAWYDPSDLTTLFQDSAGTTPVTTPGQSVGRMLDKSGRGNHATQSNAAQRPTYGIVPATGRRNLLINTTTLSTQSVTVAAGSHTLSFTGTGTVTLTGAAIGALVGIGVSDRVSLTFTTTAGSLTLTVAGSVTVAQLETGSTATAYQRVGTAFDVTEAGVASRSYVSFDGTDDGMLTGNIVPGIDKAQVFAGVRKLSDAATGEVVGLSTSPGGLAGTFFLRAPNSASASYQYRSRGTTANGVIYTNALVAAPVTNVLTGLSDISGPSEALRVNGAVVGSNTLTQGTGNYLTYPLYIGRSGGTTLPFNGQIFGLIVRFGTNLPAATITQTETWLGARVAPTVVI
jgi:hypothetical protein